jgi:hypothetical protein
VIARTNLFKSPLHAGFFMFSGDIALTARLTLLVHDDQPTEPFKL